MEQLEGENSRSPILRNHVRIVDTNAAGGDVQWRDLEKRFDTNRSVFHNGAKVPFIWMPENQTFVGYENKESLQNKFGYCGSGAEFCDCPECINFGADPLLILKEPVKPTQQDITWYTADAGDGKRGRCGPGVPPLNGGAPTCNPDDPTAHCCSNGGYCGNSKEHCECQGCIDFAKKKDFKYKPVEWWTYAENPANVGRCGPDAPRLPSGKLPKCDPDTPAFCFSHGGYCGGTKEYCDCLGCVDFKKLPNYEY